MVGGDGGLDGRWRGWTCQIKTVGNPAGSPGYKTQYVIYDASSMTRHLRRRGASLEAGHHIIGPEAVGQGGAAYGLDSPDGLLGQVAREELQLWGSDGGAAYDVESGGRLVSSAGHQRYAVLERAPTKGRPFLCHSGSEATGCGISDWPTGVFRPAG